MSVPYGQAQLAEPVGDGDEYALRPTDTPTYDVGQERDARIVDWRLLCFLNLGFPEVTATAMAVRRDVCRQRVEDLVAAGATPAQVREILL